MLGIARRLGSCLLYLLIPWICVKKMLLFNGMVAATIRFICIPPPWVYVVVKYRGIAKWKWIVITICLMLLYSVLSKVSDSDPTSVLLPVRIYME